MDICNAFGKEYTAQPLKDHPGEQEPGRTFKIVPADNGATSQIDAVIKGTTKSAASFLKVTKSADSLYAVLSDQNKSFFNTNLLAQAAYMQHLNGCLLNISMAYQTPDKTNRQRFVQKAITSLKDARKALLDTQYGNFSSWYAGDKVFGFNGVFAALNKLEK